MWTDPHRVGDMTQVFFNMYQQRFNFRNRLWSSQENVFKKLFFT